VKHHYREDSWPEGKTAPYQVLLDEEHVKDEQKNAIWARLHIALNPEPGDSQ